MLVQSKLEQIQPNKGTTHNKPQPRTSKTQPNCIYIHLLNQIEQLGRESLPSPCIA